jgi:predicted kinase
LLESLDAICVRSDIERKRLHRLAPHERSGSGVDSGIYSADASQRTYARLAQLATMILRAGYSAIVDAAFLRRAQRDQLRAVAEQEHARFIILDMQTPESTLQARLQQRPLQKNEASEAGLTVLQHQLATREPLLDDEQAFTLAIDGTQSVVVAELQRQLQARLAAA